ncbi:MAG TPA: CAP domain-containing protein [Edaphobacter sp.]|nr:CAP domain-containing protein [Edaphobacter sp.]
MATLGISLTETTGGATAACPDRPSRISLTNMHNTIKTPISVLARSVVSKSLLALLAIAILATAAPRTRAQSQVQSPGSPEQTLLQFANQAREAHNLPPLQWDDSLARAAKAHLQWVLRNPNNLLHQYPGEPDLVTRGANAGAHFGTISENIAGHGDTPASLHEIWMTTASHRANILDPKLNVVGIAVAENQGLLYAVEDFARNTPALGPEAIERQVAKLLQDRGFPPAASNADARKTCEMPRGQEGNPKLVIRWDGADISELPPAVAQQLDKTKYNSAAVGACPSEALNQQFTTYHIVVLLY